MAVDRNTWAAPIAPQRGRGQRLAGALGGTLLLEQPRYAELRSQIRSFVESKGPLAVEIGFDHGINLLANARLFADWRWLGVELRRHRVTAVEGHAPDNCLPLRLDARILFGALLLADEVDRIDILFPTPTAKSQHLLLTSNLVAHFLRTLRPGGVVHIVTDVRGIDELAQRLFVGWASVSAPLRAPDLSRRERVCRRDGLQVWRRTFQVPRIDD